MINIDVSLKERRACEKEYAWNPVMRNCTNGKCLDGSAITCHEVIESYDEDKEAKSYGKTKTISTNLNGKKATSKMEHSHNLMAFFYLL